MDQTKPQTEEDFSNVLSDRLLTLIELCPTLVFTSDFVKSHTDYSDSDDLLEDLGIDGDTDWLISDDFAQESDSLIDENTDFSSWRDFCLGAVKYNIRKHVDDTLSL